MLSVVLNQVAEGQDTRALSFGRKAWTKGLGFRGLGFKL